MYSLFATEHIAYWHLSAATQVGGLAMRCGRRHLGDYIFGEYIADYTHLYKYGVDWDETFDLYDHTTENERIMLTLKYGFPCLPAEVIRKVRPVRT